ncbi:hypothetical protein EDB81DRAFT_865238 [Dactylonectria macrodidyma]|uniref:FAD-binding domain-containing protein n=1 Tax=Dactylonectria macrodidyma TaxID=307937 RepID=A0A9P9FS68_9HYPO|nr:hypothetical protein EDB81DRAFT_865238 [Dactylonectria macrodidyma]
MGPDNFRVIVVGGGPSGLTAAHALHLANINFVVLERRENIIEDLGASLVLAAPSLRVMHQFGILKELLAIGREIDITKSFDVEGRAFKNSTKIQLMRKNHGSCPVAFHRAHLVEVLYNRLPAQAKANIHPRKSLSDIESFEDGVRVTCTDGSVYEGSIVIGADGVHSKTRRLMRKLALQADPSRDWDLEEPFVSSYKCMWASFLRPSEESGQNYDTQHKDRSLMYITGHERSWVFLYKKLPEPTQERAFYSQRDMNGFATEFEDFPVNETLKLRDLWEKRITTGMANLEEGLATHWSFGRVVLVGDACHKFTPNAGLGLNNGIQDVVMLCNGLRDAICTDPLGRPSQSSLAHMFEAYQETRQKMVKSDALRSAGITRMHAWESLPYYLMSKYVMSWTLVDHFMLDVLAARAISQAFVLNYVPGEEILEGKVPWKHPIPSCAEKV